MAARGGGDWSLDALLRRKNRDIRETENNQASGTTSPPHDSPNF
jgi:hypothetical protein